jgi:TPR repeat protein
MMKHYKYDFAGKNQTKFCFTSYATALVLSITAFFIIVAGVEAKPKVITAPDVALIRKAAENGMESAQYDLAMKYVNGQGGLAKDEAQAVYWFQKAAEQGNYEAQFNLGVMYTKGEGVTKDETQGVNWWRKAAEQGFPPAQRLLGVKYLTGGGGLMLNERQGLPWLQKAANQGDEQAQKLLESHGVDWRNATEKVDVTTRYYNDTLKLKIMEARAIEDSKTITLRESTKLLKNKKELTDSDTAHIIACKISYISSIRPYEKMPNGVEQYLLSKDYENVMDKTARNMLEDAFKKGQKMLIAFNAIKQKIDSRQMLNDQDGLLFGQLNGQITNDTGYVCSHLRFPECEDKAFENKSVPFDKAIHAEHELAECGKYLWNEKSR